MGGLFFNLDEKLASVMSALGYKVGEHPWMFIIVPFFVTALLGTGFQRMVYEQDFEKLLIPSGAVCFEERDLIESYFPMNYSDFIPDRATNFGRYVSALVYASDGGDVFREQIFSKVVEIHETLTRNVSIGDDFEEEGRSYKWEDLCSKHLGKCFDNTVIQLADVIGEIETGESSLSYPFTFHPHTMETIILAGFIANPKLNDDDTIAETKALKLQYFLDGGSPQRIERSYRWEKAALDLLRQMNESQAFSNVSIFYVAESSLGEEMDSLIWYIIPKLGFTAGLILVAAAVCTWSPVKSERNILFGIAGAVASALGCIAGMGLLFYCGIRMSSGALATPFLILGIGMDDCFVLLAFWRKTNPHDPVPKRLAETYGGAAVSITITSLTNALSFSIGCITPFLMARLFCIHTGVCVLAVYLLGITFLGGVLALSGYREAEQLNSTPGNKIILPPRASEVALPPGMEKKCSLFDTIRNGMLAAKKSAQAGVSTIIAPNPPSSRTPRDGGNIGRNGYGSAPFKNYDEEEKPKHFFSAVSNLLAYKVVKIGVVICMAIYLSGAIYGMVHIKEGASTSGMVADTSHYVKFFNRQSNDFMDFAVRVPVVLTGDYNYSDPSVQAEIEMVMKKIEQSNDKFGDDLYTDSWLRGFLQFVKRNKELGIDEGLDITDEANFTKLLKSLYLTEDNVYTRDVAFNKETGRIEASRFVFQARNLETIDDSRLIMQALRDLFYIELKDYNLTSYHPLYRFGEQFDALRSGAISSILVAIVTMIIVALFLLPDWRCAVWIGLSVLSIEIGVVGYSSFFGVNLDAVSSGVLIMCIGFSVDYSAHVSHAYLHSKALTTTGRVDDALGQVGVPILQGALSTFLAIVTLFFIPSYIFRVFFTCVTFVIILGAIHGLIFLPVLFSIFIGVRPVEEEQSSRRRSLNDIKMDKNDAPRDGPKDGKKRRDSVLDRALAMHYLADAGFAAASAALSGNKNDTKRNSFSSPAEKPESTDLKAAASQNGHHGDTTSKSTRSLRHVASKTALLDEGLSTKKHSSKKESSKGNQHHHQSSNEPQQRTRRHSKHCVEEQDDSKQPRRKSELNFAFAEQNLATLGAVSEESDSCSRTSAGGEENPAFDDSDTKSTCSRL